MNFWSDKRVWVAGGTGFLGRHVVKQLMDLGCREVFFPNRQACDLRDVAQIQSALREFRPHHVIHLAAVVGGIGANRAHPGQFFYENMVMGVHLVEECRLAGVEKMTLAGTICSYPKITPIPFREENLWYGYPEETNAPYGMAKKMLLVQSRAYREEYGFSSIFLLPVNLYGPGDNFDPGTSHVIPALIRRAVEAKDRGADQMVCWGSGSATREFLYVEDCARALVLAAERYDGPEPVNVGSGMEISIRDLAALVASEVGFEGEIVWDLSKPDGQPRRCLDTSRAEALFGFRAAVPFAQGLRKTVAWYLAQRPQ